MINKLLVFSVLATAVTGCFSSPPSDLKVDEWRKLERPVGDLDGLALVSSSQIASWEFTSCVERKLTEAMPGKRIIPATSLRDSGFPWFEPKILPTDAQSWSLLINRPLVRAYLDRIQLRYVIDIHGSLFTDVSKLRGPTEFGAIWETEARIRASIWSVSPVRMIADMELSTSGGVIAGTIFLIPVFAGAPGAETAACNRVARNVANFLKGKSRPPRDVKD